MSVSSSVASRSDREEVLHDILLTSLGSTGSVILLEVTKFRVKVSVETSFSDGVCDCGGQCLTDEWENTEFQLLNKKIITLYTGKYTERHPNFKR